MIDRFAPPIQTAFAHCDVPCGIYDPIVAQTAAHSVARFLDQVGQLEAEDLSGREKDARLARLIEHKEKHAAQVKSEVVIIWGDYFKQVHFDEHPELHTMVHKIMQVASKCKQEIDPENGRNLVNLVNDFATVFWKTKSIETETVVAPYLPKLPLVRPCLEAA